MPQIIFLHHLLPLSALPLPLLLLSLQSFIWSRRAAFAVLYISYTSYIYIYMIYMYIYIYMIHTHTHTHTHTNKHLTICPSAHTKTHTHTHTHLTIYPSSDPSVFAGSSPLSGRLAGPPGLRWTLSRGVGGGFLFNVVIRRVFLLFFLVWSRSGFFFPFFFPFLAFFRGFLLLLPVEHLCVGICVVF
jgi:hypothetical protein